MPTFILFFFLVITLYAAPLTETQLNQVTLEQIHKDIKSFYMDQEWKIKKFEASYPLFFEMIARENEPGFFGYHGHTQKYRIFQDILRVVHEEVFHEEIPEDFQFLRIPGEPLFDLNKGTKSFYDLYDPQNKTEEQQKMAVKYFIIDQINQRMQKNISLETFSDQEINSLFQPIADHILKSLEDTNIKGFFPFKKDIDKELSEKFKGDPRADYKKKIISSFLIKNKAFLLDKKGTSKAGLTKLIASKIDIPEKALNTFLNQTLSPDAINDRFLSLLYTLPQEEYDFMMSLFFPYWDTRPDQQSRVISINYSLFSNYNFIGESTLDVFLSDRSIESGESQMVKALEAYFEKVGLNKAIVKPLVQSLNKKIFSYGVEGCFLQFFDRDPNLLGLDKTAYVAKPFGIPIKNIAPSKIANRDISFIREHGEIFQLRLLMTNSYTLTPNGSIRMIRYDRLPANVKDEILNEIRARIKNE